MRPPKTPIVGAITEKIKKVKKKVATTKPTAKPTRTPWGLPPGFDLKEAERQANLAREKEWEDEVNNRNAPPTWLGRRRGNWLAPSHRALGRYWNDRLRRLGW